MTESDDVNMQFVKSRIILAALISSGQLFPSLVQSYNKAVRLLIHLRKGIMVGLLLSLTPLLVAAHWNSSILSRVSG